MWVFGGRICFHIDGCRFPDDHSNSHYMIDRDVRIEDIHVPPHRMWWQQTIRRVSSSKKKRETDHILHVQWFIRARIIFTAFVTHQKIHFLAGRLFVSAFIPPITNWMSNFMARGHFISFDRQGETNSHSRRLKLLRCTVHCRSRAASASVG